MNETHFEKMLSACNEYIQFGFKLIPVTYQREDGSCSCNKPNCNGVGKHPAIKGWQTNATNNIEEIKTWFLQDPFLNIGLLTGENLCVLDIDPRNDGDSSLKELLDAIQEIPETPVVETGGGGLHFYFKNPKEDFKKSKTGMLPGLDFKSIGGFIVAPPSLHKSGKQYQFANGKSLSEISISELPENLIKFLNGKSKSVLVKSELHIAGNIMEGERNSQLFKIGCSLKSSGASEEAVLAALTKINLEQCKPQLSDSEIVQIAANSCKKAAPNNYGFVEKNNKTYRVDYDKEDNQILIELADFCARIVEEKIFDDGVEARIRYVISGVHSDGSTLPTIEIDANDFSSMTWVNREWGSRPIMYPRINPDLLRAAIQVFSREKSYQRVYLHLGWRQIDGKQIFLHATGGLDSNGLNPNVFVDASFSNMEYFELPEPPTDSVFIRESILDSLKFLLVAPEEIAFPLFASIWRAPLRELSNIDFSLFLMGPTGTFKSELAGIVQSHYGVHFNSRNLPGNFTSTSNFLERKAYLAKDTCFVIDDFVPNVTPNYVAENIFRGQGNNAGRGRMKSDGFTLRNPSFPRCLIVATGEDIPLGQSLLPRLFILEVVRESVNTEVLTELQKTREMNSFALALASYIKWIASNFQMLKTQLPKKVADYRNKFFSEQLHRRTPSTIASLFLGLDVFADFVVDVGVFNETEKKNFLEKSWNALKRAAEKQLQFQECEDPVLRWKELLLAALTSGKVHLVSAETGMRPLFAEAFGWLKNEEGYLTPHGERIGWFSEAKKEVWLNPDLAFSTIQRMASWQNSRVAIGKDTLWKRLADRGLILRDDGEKRNIQKRESKVFVPRQRVVVISDLTQFGIENSDQKTFSAPIAPILKRGELENLNSIMDLLSLVPGEGHTKENLQ